MMDPTANLYLLGVAYACAFVGLVVVALKNMCAK